MPPSGAGTVTFPEGLAGFALALGAGRLRGLPEGYSN